MINDPVSDRLTALEAVWSPSSSAIIGDPLDARLRALEAVANPTALVCMEDQVEARLAALEATPHGGGTNTQTALHESGQF